jgi:FAD/FMN-containing dehydrogenase/Fe-S oxidoreductase
MKSKVKKESLVRLRLTLQGELKFDEVSKLIYATDASSYREIPLAVAYPKNSHDLITLIKFAKKHNISLIPRTAGTSLAGQVVGHGIIVDVSRHYQQIIEFNKKENWVRVQPGVIRDDLNRFLKPHGVFFGPETSTANRAMIGGMIGNNSCGSNSVIYGSTREHLISAKVILSDGTETEFRDLSPEEFANKCQQVGLEGQLYKHASNLLGNGQVRKRIKDHYPDAKIPRRNTGYALDLLMDSQPFGVSEQPFNFCKLLAGSEGTLAFITEVKLAVSPLPPPQQGLVCVHFDSIYDSLVAAQVALKYQPHAVELIDHYILESTRKNITYSHYMFFVEGEPKAILAIELRDEADQDIGEKAKKLIAELKAKNLGYHYPIIWNEQAKLVWELRKAGLGLLSNMPGDAKPVPVIEDTAVGIEDLPEYIAQFNEILKRRDLSAVHYAHAGSGELHLRPILDLKTIEGNILFREIAEEVSKLVKRYNGSLSGEHGDGRLRGEFIPFMIGEENYQDLIDLKQVWDPDNVFNRGKITHTPSMNTNLRFDPGQYTPEYDTMLDFSSTLGIVRAAEQCNGSADCRKSATAGGTMCPSYMASGDERQTTRARANVFREIAGRENEGDPFLSHEIKDVFAYCLSCKGCKSECPSNVDIAKIKTEFLYQNQKRRGTSFRTKLIGNFTNNNRLLENVPWLYNTVVSTAPLALLFKLVAGFAPRRSLPRMNKQTVKNWFKRNENHSIEAQKGKKVLLFVDEFTNYNDFSVGQAIILVLTRLGYEVELTDTVESGRSFISKGMLDQAKVIANENINSIYLQLEKGVSIIGIEPSAILSFRDEYLDLADDKKKAQELSKRAFLFEEFIEAEIAAGNIDKALFKPIGKTIKYHGHCHQKALSEISALQSTMALIPESKPVQIPSGCCGMAGSFGYEKEHYSLSMKVGELVLFPAVREADESEIIVAPGTSCRHQIKDGTGARAFHPAEVLWLALQ